MKLNYEDFYILYTEAAREPDRDKYISEWATSSIFLPNFDLDVSDQKCMEVFAALKNIWDVAHMSFKNIRKRVGLTQDQIVKYFCIPRRTVENWEKSHRNFAPYHILMMARILHVLTVDIEPPKRHK